MPKTNEQDAVYTQNILKSPNLYKVILLNDDTTSMDFVVQILIEIFHHKPAEAIKLMLSIHEKGSAVCGTYIKEVAQTKQNEVHMAAKTANMPLKSIIEEE